MIVRFLPCLALLAATSAHAQEGARQRSHIVIPEGSQASYEMWGFAPAIRTEDGTIYVRASSPALPVKGPMRNATPAASAAPSRRSTGFSRRPVQALMMWSRS